MKIYTKHGDDGSTSLYGGKRVRKNTKRLEAVGTIDELNAILGVVLAEKPDEPVEKTLLLLQEQLFVLGADLSTPIDPDSESSRGTKSRIQRIGQEQIDVLEQTIDDLDGQLPGLKNFILPGGSRSGAALHLARTVCRRAERVAVTCSESEEINSQALIYINRLSDLLFVLARFENMQKQHRETPWIPGTNRE